MRITVTLDDDVVALLTRVRQERDLSLKQAVNDALRQGLMQLTAAPEHPSVYRTSPVSLGRCLVPSLDNVAEALAEAEGQDFK